MLFRSTRIALATIAWADTRHRETANKIRPKEEIINHAQICSINITRLAADHTHERITQFTIHLNFGRRFEITRVTANASDSAAEK